MRLWLSLSFLFACSGGSKQIDIEAPPQKVTQGTFVGPLCTGDTCKCASTGAEPGVPEAAGTKRFEVKLDSPNELWAKVGQNQLYKNAEKPTACWYVDLPTGETQIQMRASEPHGVSASWSIRELGTKTKSFYSTLLFSCGNPGACSFEELDTKKAEFKDPKTDRCGSVKVKGLAWDTGRSPDMQYPSELLVRATLHVYKFEPDRPHGADCSTKQKEEFDEQNPKF